MRQVLEQLPEQDFNVHLVGTRSMMENLCHLCQRLPHVFELMKCNFALRPRITCNATAAVAAASPGGPSGGEGGSGGSGGAVVGGRVELLVFGYACKLFRDDEKALQQEQGRHLIPWMGEASIMIDRYDGRGHLHDLSEYDAEYSTWNRDYQLSEEEARIEALCDEERYLALRTDLLEEEARQEEEYKRLSEALAEDGSYNAVGFTYSSDYYDPSEPTEEEEQPFKAKGLAQDRREDGRTPLKGIEKRGASRLPTV
ncbi:PREDICTED: splicing factor, suppressor of white-apricot homolog [Thamnophis sirtalis]|uniref:Splicing factor, suppressor of white-apricot homolog n=1 Tax=Thamnophis sirtalis TaxID=35019 RepID=A0A6I9Y721_9SAUR|nr:PREDICTED: splicing factor, suppressor of white-apricot homolog [Thamnophis sirtalis]